MNSISRVQFQILVHCWQNPGTLPPVAAGEALQSLLDAGALTADHTVTEAGMALLEPYKAKRVIFLAAGLGSRLRPATINVPKPMVRVHGQPIICSAIQAALDAGIEEIYIVRGYLGEVFDQLKRRFPQIHLIDNPLYSQSNNITSALQVENLLSNAYVMEADLLINNPKVFRTYNYTSNCLGVPVEHTDDWCVISRDGAAKELRQGGEHCHHLFSVYYWTREDGQRLPAHLHELYDSPGGHNKFWDLAPMTMFNPEYHIEIVECTFADISEIDTYHELTQIDPDYQIH